MTKDVWISITGIHQAGGQEEDLSLSVRGTYYFKDGKHYVFYEEMPEGNGALISNRLVFSPEGMELFKKGFITAHMQFETGRKNQTCYTGPFGSFVLGILAKKYRLSLREDTLNAEVVYALDMDKAYVSECRMHIEVKSAGTCEAKK